MILLIGGDDCGTDESSLLRLAGLIGEGIRILLLQSSGAQRFERVLRSLGKGRTVLGWVDDVCVGIDAALEAGEPGETVVFSPAFAAYPPGKSNLYHRSIQFVEHFTHRAGEAQRVEPSQPWRCKA